MVHMIWTIFCDETILCCFSIFNNENKGSYGKQTGAKNN